MTLKWELERDGTADERYGLQVHLAHQPCMMYRLNISVLCNCHRRPLLLFPIFYAQIGIFCLPLCSHTFTVIMFFLQPNSTSVQSNRYIYSPVYF